MALNRTDVVGRIAERSGLTLAQTDAAILALQEVLVAALAKGEPVRMTGLLGIERIERPARTGRHPRTGEPLAISARSAVKVTAGSALKAAVDS